MIACDRCKHDFPKNCAERVANGRIALRATAGGPVVGYLVYGNNKKPEAVCVTCDREASQDNEPARLVAAKALEAGLADGLVLDSLVFNARAHGVEKALLRAVAEVLHDARPVGNQRTEAEWKRISSAQATARRLAEIGAAPR